LRANLASFEKTAAAKAAFPLLGNYTVDW